MNKFMMLFTECMEIVSLYFIKDRHPIMFLFWTRLIIPVLVSVVTSLFTVKLVMLLLKQ